MPWNNQCTLENSGLVSGIESKVDQFTRPGSIPGKFRLSAFAETSASAQGSDGQQDACPRPATFCFHVYETSQATGMTF